MASLFAYHQKMSIKAYHEMPSGKVICNAILCLIIMLRYVKNRLLLFLNRNINTITRYLKQQYVL